jgi:hypothetical protein
MHSKQRSLIQAVLSEDALLSRLEGETWMGHRTEEFA